MEKEKPLPSFLRRKRLFRVFCLNGCNRDSIFSLLFLRSEKILRNERYGTNRCFAGRMNCCGMKTHDSGRMNCCGCSPGREKNCGWNNFSKELWILRKNMIYCWCCCGREPSNEKRRRNFFCCCSRWWRNGCGKSWRWRCWRSDCVRHWQSCDFQESFPVI